MNNTPGATRISFLDALRVLVRRVAFLSAAMALSACAAPHPSLPGALEPHHHLRLQNGYVRVMETRLAPGEETLLHSHPIESVVVFLTDSEFRITNDDGTTKDERVEQGAVAFGASAIVHRTANIGSTTARVVTVEIFSTQPALDGAELPAPGETLIENDMARIVRVEALPREPVSLDAPTPVVVVAEAPGALTTADGVFALKAGDARWCAPGPIGFRTSTGASASAVVVMLKPR